MNDPDILQQFESINTWQRKGVRAPHKPLLMLLALGEIQRGNIGFIPYSTIVPKRRELLQDFSPPRKTTYTTFPFIRLASDSLWQFNKPELTNNKAGVFFYSIILKFGMTHVCLWVKGPKSSVGND